MKYTARSTNWLAKNYVGSFRVFRRMGNCCGKPETDFSRHKTCRRPSAEKGGSNLPEDDDGTISIEPRYVIYRPAVEHRSTRLKPQLQVNREPTTDISPYAEQRYKDGLE